MLFERNCDHLSSVTDGLFERASREKKIIIAYHREGRSCELPMASLEAQVFKPEWPAYKMGILVSPLFR